MGLADATPQQIHEIISLRMAQKGDFREFYNWCTLETKHGLVHPDPAWTHFFDPQYSPQGISLADAMAQGKSIVILKARQNGVTSFIRQFDLFDGRFNTIMPIQVISRGEREAEEFLRLVQVSYTHLPSELAFPLEKKPTLEKFYIQGGGKLNSFPATSDAGRSFSGWRCTMDENAFHPEAASSYRSIKPQARQVVQVSTANGENYFMAKFLAVHSGQGADDEIAIFYPWWVRPDRQNADGTPAQSWYENEKRAFLADPDTGGEDDFKAEYPATVEEAKASKSGLYYGREFTKENVTFTDPWEWKDSRLRLAGVDWGGQNDPSAAVLVGQKFGARWHQFDEYHAPHGATVEELGAWLLAQTPRPSWVFCDPSQELSIRTLRRLGLNAHGRVPGTGRPLNERGAGLKLIGTLLEQNLLTLHERNAMSIHEFEGYYTRNRKHPTTRDDYATSTAVDHHGDLMDSRRYSIMGGRGLTGEISPAQGTIRTLSGRPRATQAV